MLFFAAVNLLIIGFVHNVSSSPCLSKGICSAAGGVSESVSETVQSSASSASSTYEASSSKSVVSSGSCASSFDEAYWTQVFGKCKAISDIEKQCYLKWLATFSDSELEYFTSIADYLTIQEALSTDILDFVTLQKDIVSAYDFLSTSGIYSVDVELASKKDILQEYKSKLATTLKCLAPDTPLYKLLSFSVESDIVSLPCTIGFLNTIVQGQETYFASTTSSSSSSTRSVGTSKTSSTSSTSVSSASGSSVSLTEYESILQAANIQSAEYQTYLSYLSKLNSDKLCLFTDLINYLNQNTQVLTAEMVLDFAAFDQVVQNAYKSLVAKEFYVANADWIAQKAVLSEIQSELSTALSYLSKDCGLFSALSYCLDQDVSYLPLFVGVSNYLLQQQSSYFAASSSCSSSVTQSATSVSSSSATSVCA